MDIRSRWIALCLAALGAAPAVLFGQLDQNWLTQVQETVRGSEYNVSWQDRPELPDLAPAYQAPNRAHDLLTEVRRLRALFSPRA